MMIGKSNGEIHLVEIYKIDRSFDFSSEHIAQSIHPPITRSQPGRHSSTRSRQIARRSSLNISGVFFWGTAITIGGLALLLWHQSQSIDPAKFMSLGDFLAQLYR